MSFRRRSQIVVLNFCGLCGHDFETSKKHALVDQSQISLKREEWAKSYKRQKYAVGKPEDLSEIYFRSPWKRFYRAIIHQADSVDEYRLTGVAIYKNQVDHVFPDDPEKLILGDPEKWPEKPLSAALGYVRNGKPYTMHKKNAYPVHERCWSLMLRILDIGLVEKHLDSSIKVLCQQAGKNRNAKNLLVNMQGCWGEPKRRYKDMSWEESEKYAKACEQQMSCTDDSCFNRFYAPRDPFNIPELRSPRPSGDGSRGGCSRGRTSESK